MRSLHSGAESNARFVDEMVRMLKEFESIVFRHFILILRFAFTHLKMAFGISIGTQTFSLFSIFFFWSNWVVRFDCGKPENAACALEHRLQTYKRTIIVLFIKHLVCSIRYRLILDENIQLYVTVCPLIVVVVVVVFVCEPKLFFLFTH